MGTKSDSERTYLLSQSNSKNQKTKVVMDDFGDRGDNEARIQSCSMSVPVSKTGICITAKIQNLDRFVFAESVA